MKNLVKIICASLVFLMVLGIYSAPSTIKADPLDDINAQIQAKLKEQQATLKKIKDIESNIKNLSKNTSNLTTLIGDLQNQQKDLDEQIKTLDQQIADQDKNLDELNKVLSEKQDNIRQKINYLYKLSYSQPNIFLGSEGDFDTYLSERAELNFSISVYKDEIKDYYSKIDLAKQLKDQSTKDKQTAADTKTALVAQISEVQKQIAANNAAIAAANNSKNQLNALISAQNRQLDQLSALQKSLMDEEQKLYLSNPPDSTKVINPGDMYFYGRGNDYALYSHGVGMSQYGALGAAVNAGMNANQILTFYYSGVSIADYHSVQNRETINVDGYGTMSIDDYVSGIGEVPDNACEDMGRTFSLSSFWTCWPKETIKAQVIAARTYALNYTKNGNSICTSTSCQVYKGGKAKKWANDATKNQVITYGGTYISAVYSADNSQGFGTANNDTVWSNNSGVGTAYAYLRAKNDSGFAFHMNSNNVEWTTNGFSIADIQKAMEHMAAHPEMYSSSGFFSGVLNNIGTLRSISITKDPSRRVKFVTVTGTNGVSKNIAGWLFKAMFANWSCKVGRNNVPKCDYILSLTFDFNIK